MWKRIIQVVLNVLKKIASISSKYKKFKQVFKYGEFKQFWKRLSPIERDRVRKELRKNGLAKKIQKEYDKKIITILNKEITNIPLSTIEKQMLKDYEDIFMNEKEPEIIKYHKDHKFDKANSSWISSVIYYPDTRICKVLMESKTKSKWYNFYNVPKTKFLALIKVGGRYMWDYFGKHYSLNPKHWIRTTKMTRRSTQNTTNTKTFKKWARAYDRR